MTKLILSLSIVQSFIFSCGESLTLHFNFKSNVSKNRSVPHMAYVKTLITSIGFNIFAYILNY